MSRVWTTIINLLGVLGAVSLGLLGLVWSGQEPGARPEVGAQPATLELSVLADGGRAIRDASGRLVPLRPYRRIASASTVSDALLLEFASPEQVVSFTTYSADNEWFGYRYAGKPHVDALRDVESLLALSPDLLLVSTLSSGSRLERLRETNVEIFSIGEMRGVDSFLANARAIATLVGRPQLGEVYADAYLRRLRSIAAKLPASRRRTAIQLTYYGNKIYGSGRDTSYHDVLTYAGLVDVGAHRYHGWPAWSIEQVLELDPDYVITRDGMGHQLCAHAALSQLAACKPTTGAPHHVIELPDAIINDPGPSMLLAAEIIHERVYGTTEETP